MMKNVSIEDLIHKNFKLTENNFLKLIAPPEEYDMEQYDLETQDLIRYQTIKVWEES